MYMHIKKYNHTTEINYVKINSLWYKRLVVSKNILKNSIEIMLTQNIYYSVKVC